MAAIHGFVYEISYYQAEEDGNVAAGEVEDGE